MTNSPESLLIQTEEGWDRRESNIHDLSRLRDILDRFTKEPDEMVELTFEGEKPIIVRRTESKNIILEISAEFKPDFHGVAGASRLISKKGYDKTDELKSLFDEMESPAVTTEEVAARLGCSPSEAIRHLTEFEHRGWIDHRSSGETVIWWPQKDDLRSLDEDELELIPAKVKRALEQSEQELKEWIRENQREGETLEETYDRIRGDPDPEDLRDLITGDNRTGNRLMEIIKEKRATDQKRKEDLQDLFE